MIPKEGERVTQVGFDQFESQNFTIAVNEQSFRILLDGLYKDKELAIVRELWTNARDAHAVAGNLDVPFECHLPNLSDATFWVRDFGCSMTHDEVMHLYTSVFTSSKTNSNTQVGMLGLGSKVPFAKADAFQVETFLDGMKRTYLASLNEQRIPTISFILAEQTAEPNGTRISFAARYQDFDAYRKAAERIAVGFDTKPIIHGGTIETPVVNIEFENWRFLEKPNGFLFGSSVVIQQGCVLYPVEMPNLVGSFGMLIIDVPIGSVSVAANRETLSMDTPTKDYLNVLHRETSESIGRYITTALESCTTYLQAVKTALELQNTFIAAKNVTWRGRSIPMTGKLDLLETVRGDLEVRTITKHSREVRETVLTSGLIVPVWDLDSLRFYIDRGQRIPRRKMRLEPYAWNRYIYFLKNPTSKQLAALVKRWELKPHQIQSITQIPDVPVTRKATFDRSGVYMPSYSELVKGPAVDFDELDEFYVIPVDAAKGGTARFPKLGLNVMTNNFSAVHELTTACGIAGKTYVLTPQAQKRLDGAGESWEDYVYDKLMEVKDQALALYRSNMWRGSYRDVTILQALVDAGEVEPLAPESKKHTDLDLIATRRTNLFAAELSKIDAEVEAQVKALEKKYPLIPYIDPWAYRRNPMGTQPIIDYINLMKKAD